MADFQPLSTEQYQKARLQFSPEQILQFEQKRKADSMIGTGGPTASSGGFWSGVGSAITGGLGFLKNVGTGITKTAVDTAGSLDKLSSGAADYISGKITGQTYNTPQNPFIQNVSQSASDLTKGTVGGPVGEVLGTVGQFAAPGPTEGIAIAKVAPYLSKIPEALGITGRAAETLIKALTLATKTAVKGTSAGTVETAQSGDVNKGLGTGLLTGGLELVAPVIKASGKLLTESVIPTSSKEAYLLQNYKAGKPFWQRVMSAVTGESTAPTTGGSTAFDKGLMGTESMVGVQAKRASTNLWDGLINPALEKSSVKQDMGTFFDEIKTQIIKDNPEPSRQKSLLNALEAMKEDYKGTPSATMKELQKFKEGWAEFVPDKAYKGQPIAGAFKDVQDTAASMARQKIYDALGPEAKQAYFDYGNLKGLQELGQKAMTGGPIKAGGTFTGLHNIWQMAVTPIGTFGGQIIYKVGSGIELFGGAGAKVVSDIIAPPTDTSTSSQAQ